MMYVTIASGVVMGSNILLAYAFVDRREEGPSPPVVDALALGTDLLIAQRGTPKFHPPAAIDGWLLRGLS